MGGAAAVAGVGLGLQAYGIYEGKQAAKREGRKQRELDRRRQEIARIEAKEIVTSGLISERILERDAVRLADNQLIAFAGRGIDITSGAPQAVIEDTARTTAADIITLKHNVKRDVWAKGIGAEAIAAESQLNRIRERNAQKAANIQLFSTLLKGGANLAI